MKRLDVTADELALGLSYDEMERHEDGPEKAAHYLVTALVIDGGHHKQWCVERALAALGVDLTKLRNYRRMEGRDLEEGIAP